MSVQKTAVPDRNSPAKPRIVIVEDETITAHHLRRVLSQLGYEVAGIASSGASALDLISRTNPDLILADIGLEGAIDGIEVAAAAREKWNVPAVFLTAYSDPKTMRRARVTEPYGYLVKPFAEEELHATIEIALQQKSIAAHRDLQVQESAQILGRTREELSVVSALLFSSQERERERIAGELHDDINQRLALLRMDLDGILASLPAAIRETVSEGFRAAIGEVDEVADDLRQLSHRLHPQILNDLGLERAIRDLCETFSRRHSKPVQFSTRNIPEEIAASTSLALYRIAQEGLQNIAKHAQAESAHIALVGARETLELSIRDNGRGFDAGTNRRAAGIGLITMAQRANLAGGSFEIQSQPNKGTRIRVSVPLKARNEQNAETAAAGTMKPL